MVKISSRVLSCLIGLSLCAVNLAGSAGDTDQDEVLELRREGKVLPFQRILKSVFERYPDVQILEVELEEDDGQYLYEIDILTEDSVVRELEIDARTGRILDDERDD